MRIGELAERTGASVRSLRYYEEQGLLEAERSASGQRHYTEPMVERVTLLRQLYQAGLTSRTIAGVLPCTYDPSVQTSDEAFERMVGEREKLQTQIDALTSTLGSLDELIAINRAWRASQDDGADRARQDGAGRSGRVG